MRNRLDVCAATHSRYDDQPDTAIRRMSISIISRGPAVKCTKDLRSQSTPSQRMEGRRPRGDGPRRAGDHPFPLSGQVPGNALSQSRPSQQHSSPLAQRQWADVPLPYRPRDWSDSDDPVQNPNLPHDRHQPHNPEFSWRLRPGSRGEEHAGEYNTTTANADRRRPINLQDSSRLADPGNTFQAAIDMSLLYPQMSPYNTDQFDVNVEPPHFFRSVSQPATPSYLQGTHTREHEFQPSPLPRSPTYPPASRRRAHSAAGTANAPFANDEEFQLFAQATTGFGPDQPFHDIHQQYSTAPLRRRGSSEEGYPYGRHQLVSPLEETPSTMRGGRFVSPIEQTLPIRRLQQYVSPQDETPSTLRALQSFAQLPQHSQEHRGRVPATDLSLESWLQSHGVPSIGVESPASDEPPDYASSQAQAQAGQREEAARRAKALVKRWHETGGRRGL